MDYLTYLSAMVAEFYTNFTIRNATHCSNDSATITMLPETANESGKIKYKGISVKRVSGKHQLFIYTEKAQIMKLGVNKSFN